MTSLEDSTTFLPVLPELSEQLVPLIPPQATTPQATTPQATTPRAVTSMNDYIIGKCISDDGSFGIVHLVKSKTTNQLYVMKKMSKREIESSDMVEQIHTEIRIHKSLDHPNVVKVIDSFEDQKYLYVILEYMFKGDAYDMLHVENKYEMFEENAAKPFVRDIASALCYIHEKGIVHRDMKLENLLVDEFGTIKLADFGWAVDTTSLPTLEVPAPQPPTKLKGKITKKDRDREKMEDEMTILCGTTEYMPPEMLQGQKYSFGVDVWAAGIVMFELLTGDIPFNKRFRKDKKLFKRQILSAPIKYPDHMSAEAVDLLKKMLERDPTKRISAREVLTHSWLQSTK